MPGLEQELGTGISQAEMLHSSSMWKQVLQGEIWAAVGTGGHSIVLLSLAEVRVRACLAPLQARCSEDLRDRQKISCKHPLNTQPAYFSSKPAFFSPKPAHISCKHSPQAVG